MKRIDRYEFFLIIIIIVSIAVYLLFHFLKIDYAWIIPAITTIIGLGYSADKFGQWLSKKKARKAKKWNLEELGNGTIKNAKEIPDNGRILETSEVKISFVENEGDVARKEDKVLYLFFRGDRPIEELNSMLTRYIFQKGEFLKEVQDQQILPWQIFNALSYYYSENVVKDTETAQRIYLQLVKGKDPELEEWYKKFKNIHENVSHEFAKIFHQYPQKTPFFEFLVPKLISLGDEVNKKQITKEEARKKFELFVNYLVTKRMLPIYIGLDQNALYTKGIITGLEKHSRVLTGARGRYIDKMNGIVDGLNVKILDEENGEWTYSNGITKPVKWILFESSL